VPSKLGKKCTAAKHSVIGLKQTDEQSARIWHISNFAFGSLIMVIISILEIPIKVAIIVSKRQIITLKSH